MPLLLTGQSSSHFTPFAGRRAIDRYPTRAIFLLHATSTVTSVLPSTFPPRPSCSRFPSAPPPTTESSSCNWLVRLRPVPPFRWPRSPSPATAVRCQGPPAPRSDQELFVGVEEIHGLCKTTLAGRQFYFYETRRGIEQHIAMATDFDGYVVTSFWDRITKKSCARWTPHSARSPFSIPRKPEIAGAEAHEYEGPAISAHRLAQLRADPPAGHVDPGRVNQTLPELHPWLPLPHSRGLDAGGQGSDKPRWSLRQARYLRSRARKPCRARTHEGVQPHAVLGLGQAAGCQWPDRL